MARIAIGEQFEPAIQTIEDYVSEMQSSIEDIFNDAAEVISNTNYNMVYQTFLGAEKVYNEKVSQQIKTNIDNWAESEGSYYNMAKAFGLGDEVLETAKKQQDEIVDTIHSIKNVESISSYKMGSEVNFDLNEVQKMLEDIYEKSKKINDVNDTHMDSLKKFAEDNEMAKSLISVGILFGDNLSQFIIDTTNNISDILSEKFNVIKSKIESYYNDSLTSSKKIVEENKAYVEEVSKNTKDLFD